jgi:hypothetical protein
MNTIDRIFGKNAQPLDFILFGLGAGFFLGITATGIFLMALGK